MMIIGFLPALTCLQERFGAIIGLIDKAGLAEADPALHI